MLSKLCSVSIIVLIFLHNVAGRDHLPILSVLISSLVVRCLIKSLFLRGLGRSAFASDWNSTRLRGCATVSVSIVTKDKCMSGKDPPTFSCLIEERDGWLVPY